MADFFILRKVSEVYMLRHGINLESIKQMDEEEAMLYVTVLNVFDEIENEQVRKNQ